MLYISIGASLRVKYHLEVDPNDEDIKKWYELGSLIHSQYNQDIETSYHFAAERIFGARSKNDPLGVRYNSQPQSIMVLLQQFGEIINGK